LPQKPANGGNPAKEKINVAKQNANNLFPFNNSRKSTTNFNSQPFLER
jgi:hypothetical protein